MSRIRSIHPGLFTDEAFVSVSMAARVLALGTWTECDDHGVFEWKPLTLKMKVFPADNADVDALLTELAAANMVKAFQQDGKKYGAVRNFCRYQRPKKPAYRHPLPNELRTYVHLSAIGSEPVTHQESTTSEKPPQMEDGGGKKKDANTKIESETHIRAVAKATRPDAGKVFDDEFWPAYPKREGENPKAPARKAFITAVKSGHDPSGITAGAKRYAETLRKSGQIGTRYVAQAVTWLHQARWEDHNADAAEAKQAEIRAEKTSFYVKDSTPEMDAWDAHYRATRGVGASRDRNGGWRFPTQWPPGHAATTKAPQPQQEQTP